MSDKKSENQGEFDNPLTKDIMMERINQLLDSQDFESEEEMKKFMDENVIGASIDDLDIEETPKMKANRKVEEAYDSSVEDGWKLAEEALGIYPQCANAYIYFAHTSDKIDEIKKYYEKAIEVAREELGEEIFEEDVGHFWGITETRPYMRAKAGYAQILKSTDRINEAIKIYKELLRLNPNDNQGIRFELMPLLLQKNRLNEYKNIRKEFEDEHSTQALYNQVLYSFKKYGGVKRTTILLREAINENPYVIPYLLGEEEMPEQLPGSYRIGDPSEAAIYVYESFKAWINDKKAMEWLYSFWQKYKQAN